MTLDTIKKNKGDRGFTIVELLIVIVIIAVLAAITIVAYTGITTRAKTSSAQTAANSVAKKAEVYAADATTNRYPITPTELTDSTSSGKTWNLTGVTFDGAAVLSTSNLPTSPSELNFYKCGTGATTPAPTTLVGITTVTGARIDYWNYTTAAVGTVSVGTIAPAVIGTYNVGCVLAP